MKDYYQILGLSRGAPEEEIKRAYRRLAKQYHPDVNKGDRTAEEKFKEISEAYSVLSDPEKKKQYDMFGSGAFHGGFDSSEGFQGFRWQTSDRPGGAKCYTYTTDGLGGVEWPDLGNLGDIFGDLFGFGGFTRPSSKRRSKGRYTEYEGPQPKDGGDTYTNLEISFEEAVSGTETRMSIQRDDKVDRITVKIPAGVDNGSKVRVKGKGHPGINGGRPGDLYLNIRVRPHKTFWREGADIYCEVPISIYESIFGGKITVPTLSGSATMTVPPGTSGGQKFRLKGKGAPLIGKGGKGDQYVIVNVVPPKEMEPETRKILEELSRRSPYNPRE